MCGTDHLHRLIKLNLWNAYKRELLLRQYSQLPPPREASAAAGCVSFIFGLSLEHRWECNPAFSIRAPLPGQHFYSNVYEIIALPILTTNSRTRVSAMPIGRSLLLGVQGSVPLLLSSFQTTAGDGRQGRAAHLLEGARTLTGFIGKKPMTSLKESQDFQARRQSQRTSNATSGLYRWGRLRDMCDFQGQRACKQRRRTKLTKTTRLLCILLPFLWPYWEGPR